MLKVVPGPASVQDILAPQGLKPATFTEACPEGCGGFIQVYVIGKLPIRKPCSECNKWRLKGQEEEERRKTENWETSRYQRIGIPKAYSKCSLATEFVYDFRGEPFPRELMGTGRYFVTSDHEMLTIASLRQWKAAGSAVVLSNPQRGLGKSHLMAAFGLDYSRLHNGRRSVLWLSIRQLYLALRAKFESDLYDSGDGLLERATKCDLLLIDDLGYGTDGRSREIKRVQEMIIGLRYDGMLDLMATTNLSLSGLRECLDDATASRLYEMATVRGGRWDTCEGRLNRRYEDGQL